MTANTAQLAATLASLAAMLAEQEIPEPAAPTPPARKMPDRVLLTVEEAAEQLGIGRTKTYALVKAGELESVQIGRLRRVPKAAIEDYANRLISQRNA
ncbi:DNA-binding protein [Saccharopolyspora aridisoli]|uniref:DNA-binding protein n=1 Tax=Saccharopolyspora aridisoli TaxID=2530385 RepID=A0A4R4UWJ2_9PSEU|nr:helix-turn-helix domain-containing protein [Saccharopolyspora aridisoli]TDC94032.1 DNA-binding protein [Saccharopolyspora aridisoli]